MKEKDLLIKEYLRVKKEAIYSRIIFLLTAVTGAILSFILVYSRSRNLIFENVSIYFATSVTDSTGQVTQVKEGAIWP